MSMMLQYQVSPGIYSCMRQFSLVFGDNRRSHMNPAMHRNHHQITLCFSPLDVLHQRAVNVTGFLGRDRGLDLGDLAGDGPYHPGWEMCGSGLVCPAEEGQLVRIKSRLLAGRSPVYYPQPNTLHAELSYRPERLFWYP